MRERASRYFYGFEFLGGKGTTTGEPNRRTGRCSIAGTFRAFHSAVDLDRWINAAPAGRERLAVALPRLRALLSGKTTDEFKEAIRAAQFDAMQIEMFDN